MTRHVQDAGMAAHPGFENCEDPTHFVPDDEVDRLRQLLTEDELRNPTTDELRTALAGMVYLYDLFGFAQYVRSNTDPTLEWLNIIWRAKLLARGSSFVPPSSLKVAKEPSDAPAT